MSTVDIGLGRASLRQALAAVLPHVGSNPSFGRVRLLMHSAEHLFAIATDGYSTGVARVAVHEVLELPELPCIDIEARTAKELLAVFTPPKDKDQRSVWETESFRVVAMKDQVTVTEESDLADNRRLEVPRLGEPEYYPLVPEITTAHLRSTPTYTKRVGVNPGYLARFIASSKAYGGEQLLVEPRHGAKAKGFTFRVGEDFAGVLLPQHLDPAELAAGDEWWADLLGTLTTPMREVA
ncbi:MAG TPA: hypothetical protein VIP06_03565 [Nocardioides sp.]